MAFMDRVALGIDLGGTKIEAVVVRLDPLAELARLRVPTERELGYDAVLARTADAARQVAARAGVDLLTVPAGVGMPGAVTRQGVIKNSNTVCLNGRPFREDLSRALGRPLAFDNDANCFALAESELGAGRPHRDGVVFGVILGTGVGGGVVMGGHVWSGRHGIAGEWGHHAVWAGAPDARECYCGQRGCLESYASGPAVEAQYARSAGKHAPLAEIAQRRDRDPHAREAIDSLLDAFGRGLANVIDVLDPSAIVLGGGVSNLDVLYTEGVERVARYVFNDELTTPILRHEMGDSAGVLGAALLAAPRERERAL
jgi:fructokinase